jgi:tetratricopeptide (TPR) repeat protein
MLFRRRYKSCVVGFGPLLCGVLLACANSAWSQDTDEPGIGSIEIPEVRMPLCFGFSDITDVRALEVCSALNLDENVKARELSEQWLREQPDNPAAQFALAEVLFTVEGNMARALYHLNRAEELTGYTSLTEAIAADNVIWHYLTLSQLSYVHQLMGNQLKSLEYLDKLHDIYGQEIESFRGWPLIKLKQYEAARASANLVLQTSDNARERSRAWNTLCAVELASLQPIESLSACDRAIDEDENLADSNNDYDTVYLSNASEVSLSLLQIDKAEEYLDRATRYLNPDSVADPWIYKLYLTMNQSRFDEAREALDRMLIWRETQDPVVSVMNRAEHFLVSASFLLLAGYAEDAIKLTATALNQPDRNGSYSADDAQKDSFAALLNMMANETEYQVQLEMLSTMSLAQRLQARPHLWRLQLDAWRAERRAASLYASSEVLLSRLRPYSPLDVHVPEWIEPEIIRIMGTGVMSQMLTQADAAGAFTLNHGYYNAYGTEIAALEHQDEVVLGLGERALTELPSQESLLRGRVSARMAQSAWELEDYSTALALFRQAYALDPSITRRLGLSLPVTLVGDDTALASEVMDLLARSPRFHTDPNGLRLEVTSTQDLSICLKSRSAETLTCYTMAPDSSQGSAEIARQLVLQFHTDTFGLGFDISKAQRSMLLGSSVILSAQTNGNQQNNRDAVLNR